jgi:hypothetical protein
MLVLADWMDENLGHDGGRAMRWAVENERIPASNKKLEDDFFWDTLSHKGEWKRLPGGLPECFRKGHADSWFHPAGCSKGCRAAWLWLIDNFPDELRHTPL